MYSPSLVVSVSVRSGTIAVSLVAVSMSLAVFKTESLSKADVATLATDCAAASEALSSLNSATTSGTNSTAASSTLLTSLSTKATLVVHTASSPGFFATNEATS